MRKIRHNLRYRLRDCLFAAGTLALCLVAGCSPDAIAASNAAQAQAALNQGRLADAGIAIRKALVARDDIIDYWLLKAHIDIKEADRQGAYGDYQYAHQLDPENLEALQALCQLGPSQGNADDIEKYADQLLLLTPGAAAPLIAKGVVANFHGDSAQATALADRVLAQDPQNLAAISLKSQILIGRGQYADAASLVETAPDSPGKLNLLKTVYIQAQDRPAYELTVRRLEAVAPNEADIQLEYADMLYQDGQNDVARGVIRKVMAAYPTNLQAAAAALNVWMEAGPQALDTGRMVADAASLSLVMKADYAQFANETGHPDIAIAILRGADQGDPTSINSNAKAALAYAIGVTGHMSEAMAQLNAILDEDHDPDQPMALLARARLLAASHDYHGAVRDARLLVVNDHKNATAFLALADILQASGSPDLSLSALREGLRAVPYSTRLATRLAATLAAHGDKAQAAQVAKDLLRAAPMDQRALRLGQIYNAPTLRNFLS